MSFNIEQNGGNAKNTNPEEGSEVDSTTGGIMCPASETHVPITKDVFSALAEGKRSHH